MRATPDDNKTVQPDTTFYGGRTYANDAEFQTAVESGNVPKASPLASDAGVAVAAMPTMNGTFLEFSCLWSTLRAAL